MARIPIDIEDPQAAYDGPILFASGHRPFFLGAVLFAVGGMAVWLAGYMGLVKVSHVWHGHEMVFGFALAAVAGFLLTASPKWTGLKPMMGPSLVLLFCLWLMGRAAVWMEVAAVFDITFAFVLAATVGAGIVKTRNERNYGVPALLVVLGFLNWIFHETHSMAVLHASALVVVALLALIAGRIVPAFTQNALRMNGYPDVTCTTHPWLEKAAVPSILLVAAVELFQPGSVFTGLAALAAAVITGGRMIHWHSLKTGKIPLVWVLHAGYVWLPLAFALKAVADLTGLIGATAALHALTAGALGVMIMAVGSRAALGHSGRPLAATKVTTIAYVLVISAALVRTFVPSEEGIVVAGVLWIAGYGIFGIDYWAILTKPRIDGRPG